MGSKLYFVVGRNFIEDGSENAAFRSGLQRSISSSERCFKKYFAYCKTWSNSACKFGCLATFGKMNLTKLAVYRK